MVDQKTFRVSTSYNRPVFEEMFAQRVCVSSCDTHGVVIVISRIVISKSDRNNRKDYLWLFNVTIRRQRKEEKYIYPISTIPLSCL